MWRHVLKRVTSHPPYWCPNTMKRRPSWCPLIQSCGIWNFFVCKTFPVLFQWTRTAAEHERSEFWQGRLFSNPRAAVLKFSKVWSCVLEMSCVHTTSILSYFPFSIPPPPYYAVFAHPSPPKKINGFNYCFQMLLGVLLISKSIRRCNQTSI